MLFYQLLERVQHMHERNYIHRDIKPDNIMMGLGQESNTVHLIDFGLTRLVINPKTGQHIPFIGRKNLIGTCRYVSVNSHKGFELSRRDDLITLGYVMINLIKGNLPWQNIRISKNSARYSKVGKFKEDYPIEKLCEGCPVQFQIYMHYVTCMQFEEAPNFDLLKNLISLAAHEAKINLHDNEFDWTKQLRQKQNIRVAKPLSIKFNPV